VRATIQNAVVCACREAELPHRHFERPFSCVIEGGQAAQLTVRDMGVVEAAPHLDLA